MNPRNPSRRSAALRIDTVSGVAELSGDFLETPTEAAVQSDATLTLYVQLRGDLWTHMVGADDTATAQLLVSAVRIDHRQSRSLPTRETAHTNARSRAEGGACESL